MKAPAPATTSVLSAAPVTVTFGLLAVALFHTAFLDRWGWWILGFPFALTPLAHLRTARQAVYGGLVLGISMYAPHLGFFWTIFGPPALLLWLILAIWISAFLLTIRALRIRLARAAPGSMGGSASIDGESGSPTSPRRWGRASLWVALPPLIWTGFEYFRSELYFLRFSWLKVGDALAWSDCPGAFHTLGSFGIGTVLFLGASLFWFGRGFARPTGILLAVLVPWIPEPERDGPSAPRTLEVAGAQIESVAESEIVPELDRLVREFPNADLLVLPEYSLAGEPQPDLLAWCRTHRLHVIVGGRENLAENRFRNTAFVVDTNGTIVFRQTKSVPIQFFADGLPAASQSLWPSPWGRIGLAICYDLSYSRVMDRLVRAGAEVLIVPTMDAASWGSYQHQLHSRVAPMRAAEYGLPIVRVASSGISQVVDRQGRVSACAPTDETVRFVGGRLTLDAPGRLPFDRFLAPVAVMVTALAILGLAVQGVALALLAQTRRSNAIRRALH